MAWGLGLLTGTVLVATAVMGVGIWPAFLRFLGDYVGSLDILERPAGTHVEPARNDHDAGRTRKGSRPGRCHKHGIAGVAWIVGIIGITAWWARHDWDPGSMRFQLGFALTLVVGLSPEPSPEPA